MSDHFSTLCMKVLNKTFINSIMQPGSRINFQLVLIDCRPCEWNNWVEKRILFRIMNFARFLSIFTALSKKRSQINKKCFSQRTLIKINQWQVWGELALSRRSYSKKNYLFEVFLTSKLPQVWSQGSREI